MENGSKNSSSHRMPTAGAHQPTFFSLRGPAKALHQRAPKARIFLGEYGIRRCMIGSFFFFKLWVFTPVGLIWCMFHLCHFGLWRLVGHCVFDVFCALLGLVGFSRKSSRTSAVCASSMSWAYEIC